MPKLEIFPTNTYKKDLRRCAKRGWDLGLLDEIVDTLQNQEQLPDKYHDHALTGDRDGIRDCHIKADWVLLYEIKGNQLRLLLLETGSHSDLKI